MSSTISNQDVNRSQAFIQDDSYLTHSKMNSNKNNMSAGDLLSKDKRITDSSTKPESRNSHQQLNPFISHRNNWKPSIQQYSKIPMRSSKNTLKMLKNLRSFELNNKSSNDLVFESQEQRGRRAYAPRRDLESIPLRKPFEERNSNIIILPSVSPIISKKTRQSRTSVKKLILEPEEETEDLTQNIVANVLDNNAVKTKVKNNCVIRTSKKIPRDFYDKMLLNASILSDNKEEESRASELTINNNIPLNLTQLMRKSIEIFDEPDKKRSASQFSRHQSLKKSAFSKTNSQKRLTVPIRKVSNQKINDFSIPCSPNNLKFVGSSTNILPGNPIPTVDMLQSADQMTNARSASMYNSQTSFKSRNSSNMKIVKRELSVSSNINKKKKTRLSHDLRAFQVTVEPVEQEIEDSGFEVDINKQNFPKLFDLEDEINETFYVEESLEESKGNLFVKDFSQSSKKKVPDSPFKLRNKKSQAIYDSLSTNVKDILNKKCQKLNQVKSRSNSPKKNYENDRISNFEQKGVMTFRKKESFRLENSSRLKETPLMKNIELSTQEKKNINNEVFSNLQISYLNSTLYNSKKRNKDDDKNRDKNRKKRMKRIQNLESELNYIKKKKMEYKNKISKNFLKSNNNFNENPINSPSRSKTPLKKKKSRSPLHLLPSPKFKNKTKKNYSQKYINTFKRNRPSAKENPDNFEPKRLCSFKYAALELKNQQKKLENILESCQNTFKKLDWNINNLEDIKFDMNKFKEKKSKWKRSSKNLESKEKYRSLKYQDSKKSRMKYSKHKEKKRPSSRNKINDLYKDFCKTMDFGKMNKKNHGVNQSSKMLRINLIKKKLNRL